MSRSAESIRLHPDCANGSFRKRTRPVDQLPYARDSSNKGWQTEPHRSSASCVQWQTGSVRRLASGAHAPRGNEAPVRGFECRERAWGQLVRILEVPREYPPGFQARGVASPARVRGPGSSARKGDLSVDTLPAGRSPGGRLASGSLQDHSNAGTDLIS